MKPNLFSGWKKIVLQFCLVIVLGSFALPVEAATVAPRGAEEAPQGRVLGSKVIPIEDIQLKFAIDKNFVRIARGGSVTVTGSLTLLAPDTINIGNQILTFSFDQLKFALSEPAIVGVRIGALGATQQSSACDKSYISGVMSCDFSFTSSSVASTVWTKGYAMTFPMTLTAGDLASLDVNKSSANGELNKVLLIPRIGTDSVLKDPAFLSVQQTLTIQLFDTDAQLQQHKDDPTPDGVGDNNAKEGNGAANSGCPSITSGALCVINFVLAAVTQAFNEVVRYVMIKFLGPFIETLVSVRTYTDEFAAVIYAAWQILRNIGNIFFILAIVAIGVATVFRISGWAVKDLLVKLIVGAILINFSLTIAQAILGVADTLQNQFLGPNTGAIRAIVNPLVSTDIWKNVNENLGEFSATIQAILSFWVSFAAFIAFVGVAFLLFFRIIILWILLMLSPLPYMAMVLPVSRNLSKKWWSTFFQWAFMTPIIAFMLNLTATITQANQASGILEKLSQASNGNSTGVTTLMFAAAGQAIPIAFLFMTIKAGTGFAKGTAGFIDKALDKGAKSAFIPAALTGAAAGFVGAKVAAGAKNVAAVPLDLAKLKLAEGRNARAGRYEAGTATGRDRFMSALSAPFTAGRLLQAKRKRLQEGTKYEQGQYEQRIADLEKRKYGWSGAKVVGNRASVLGNKVLSKLGGKANVEQLSKLKTDEELRADIDKIEGKEAFIDPDDKTLDQGAIKKAIDDAKKELQDPNITADLAASKQNMINTLQGTLDNLQARDRIANIRDMDSTTPEFNKAIFDLRAGAQKQLDKTQVAPSYLADKFRIENTKGAASRLPGEYEIGAYSDFFKQAVAKGDKYGALMAAQTIEQEGDMKDFLKQMKYDNNATGLTKFYKDHFGGKQGAGKGFDVGEATMTQILRESDKRVKASGDWDLGSKIKYNPDGRKYEEETDPARLDKNIDKRIGEGSLNSLWGSITNKMAIGFDSTNNVNVVNETALQALGRVNLDDPQALKALADRINTPFAKAITTVSKVTKDQEGVTRIKDSLIKNWTETAFKAAGGKDNLSGAQVAEIEKKAERAYKMIQYGAQEANQEASAEYKQVSKDVNELRGFGRQGNGNANQANNAAAQAARDAAAQAAIDEDNINGS